MLEDYTRHQQGIIKRYYANLDTSQRQKLAELVGNLYLAEGKKRQQLWKRAATTMAKIGVPKSRIDHLLQQDRPDLLAGLVKELEGKQ